VKEASHDIWIAEIPVKFIKHFDSAVKRFGDKYPSTMNFLLEAKEEMLACDEYSAIH